jgi:adenosine kinase
MQDKLRKNIAGFGSPIVDTFLLQEEEPELSDKIRKSFKLQMSVDDKYEWDIYNQLFVTPKIELLLGGSAMNITRMTKFVLSKFDNIDNSTYFFGSTSDDDFGKLIIDQLREEGVIFCNQIFSNSMTCSNIVLLDNKDRTFFTNLGVSELTEKSFIEQYSHLFNELSLFYTDAYLISRCKDVYNFIYRTFYLNENLMLAFGMGSDRIVSEFFELIIEFLPIVDIILVNKEENECLKTKFHKTEFSDEEFIKFLANYDKTNQGKVRIIVNTRGQNDTIICVKDFQKDLIEFFSVPVLKLEPSEIIDLNGAGDAFAGGFFGGFLKGLGLVECGKLGNYIASEVIKLRGFQIPRIDSMDLLKIV